ncbi:MAG: hypothetical protein H7301_13975 [Cryobacterium sp.]|nr:hypothetical protein [Oligoflexia bacterium]
MSWSLRAVILGMIGILAFGAGLLYSMQAHAAEKPKPRVIYSKKEVDFEGLAITGELRNPGEFYFQRKTDEKFDSLVKRRKNFHREMLRDVVMAK